MREKAGGAAGAAVALAVLLAVVVSPRRLSSDVPASSAVFPPALPQVMLLPVRLRRGRLVAAAAVVAADVVAVVAAAVVLVVAAAVADVVAVADAFPLAVVASPR